MQTDTLQCCCFLKTLICIQDLCLQLKTNFGGHLPTDETKLLHILSIVLACCHDGTTRMAIFIWGFKVYTVLSHI